MLAGFLASWKEVLLNNYRPQKSEETNCFCHIKLDTIKNRQQYHQDDFVLLKKCLVFTVGVVVGTWRWILTKTVKGQQ